MAHPARIQNKPASTFHHYARACDDGLTFTGAGGAATLSGANTYAGATGVRNGAWQLTGSPSAVTTLNLGHGSNSGKFILGSFVSMRQRTGLGSEKFASSTGAMRGLEMV